MNMHRPITAPTTLDSVKRFIKTRPASEALELALYIINECDIGDVDLHLFTQAECSLGQLYADALEADRADNLRANGYATTGLWL